MELEDKDNIQIFYRGENYKQASFVARTIFNWLKINTSSEFDVFIENEMAQGVIYASALELEEFPGSATDIEDFYLTICDEFSSLKLANVRDINGLFRRLVNKYKLNEYQERNFLKKLKVSDLI